jgi:arsenate reductase
MSTRVYHNPDCGTSRNVLALLRSAGSEPDVIEYLVTPPSRQTLESLIADAGLTVRGALRIKGTPCKEPGPGDMALTDAQLIEHMLRHPILINRPFVVTERGTRLCRPSDLALDLMAPDLAVSLDKEDGAPFLRDEQVTRGDPDFVTALLDVGLPSGDLAEAGRAFFAYRTLSGRVIG